MLRRSQSHRHRRKVMQPEKCPAAAYPSPQSGPSCPPVPQRKRPATAPAQSGPSSHRTPQSRPVTSRRQHKQQIYRHENQTLMEIRKYQNSTRLLIQRRPFATLVRQVCMEYSCGMVYSWQSSTITALQEAAEAFLVELFKDSYLCSLKSKRVTLCVEDIQFARRIRGPRDGLG
ncbi:histone H3-like centromeric protein A isoform X2 [Ranitomeya variabilis]|uniref:histone H3-like centromeric protein A isoform X2 n=1 Tax=Ranitomeya variabilis TaxID=490064 RepID=UPI0040572EFD